MAGIIDWLANLGAGAPQQTTQMSGGIPIPQPRPDQNAVPEGVKTLFGMTPDDLRNRLRAAAAGMATPSGEYDGKAGAFARGFGATQKYFTEQDAATAKLAREAQENETARAVAERKEAVGDRRWEAEHGLRKNAEQRQQMVSDASIQKTKAEIERLAKTGGITTEQMLQIERISQAAAENERDPEKRKAIIESERTRLMNGIKGGGPTTISAGEGLSGNKPITGERTATGPNGEKMVLRNGNWEPLAR